MTALPMLVMKMMSGEVANVHIVKGSIARHAKSVMSVGPVGSSIGHKQALF
jgi:hypothetical protein